MIDKNIHKIFKDDSLDYNICIVGDRGYIVNDVENIQEAVDIPFGDIECFKHDPISLTERLKVYAVNMNEKCGGTCSKSKVQQCINDNSMVCLPKSFIRFCLGIDRNHIKGWNTEMWQER